MMKLYDFGRGFVDDELDNLRVADIDFVFFVLHIEKWFFYFFFLIAIHRFLLQKGRFAVEEGQPFHRSNVKENHQRLNIEFVRFRYLN